MSLSLSRESMKRKCDTFELHLAENANDIHRKCYAAFARKCTLNLKYVFKRIRWEANHSNNWFVDFQALVKSG